MEQFKCKLLELGIPSWVIIALLELKPPKKLGIQLKYNEIYSITVAANAWVQYHIPLTQGVIIIDDEGKHEVRKFSFHITEDQYHITEIKGDAYVA